MFFYRLSCFFVEKTIVKIQCIGHLVICEPVISGYYAGIVIYIPSVLKIEHYAE